MVREITGSVSLTVNKGNLKYSSTNQYFMDLDGTEGGPSPGGIIATVEGVNVDLSQLTDPGVCLIINYDATNFVEWGTWDDGEFIPLCEIGPGEVQLVKIARNLGNSYGTGTGVTDTGAVMRVKADTAACNVFVGAFER